MQYMATGDDLLVFLYDDKGTPYGMFTVLDGVQQYFFYLYNAQGDVIAIIDDYAERVANYEYSAWGELLSVTGSKADTVGVLNPFRYRGYCYDTETGFYYVSSRYYDPEIGRWINADGYVSTGQGVLGNNMFAYCLNNPISLIDCTGACPHDGKFYNDGPFEGQFVYTAGCEKCIAHGEWCLPYEQEEYLDALSYRESSRDQYKVNSFGRMGLYQFGKQALVDIGFMDAKGNWTELASKYGVHSNKDFLGDVFVQKIALILTMQNNYKYAKHYKLFDYVGKTYMGVKVTTSGIFAACHLIGAYSLSNSLKNNISKVDGYGTPADSYMKTLGGYDFRVKWE